MSNAYWQQVQSIKTRAHVAHWSVLKGKLNSSFCVLDVDDHGITVETAPGTERRISRTEFDKVAEIWPEYKERRVPRHRLNESSVNSTYILSLLHFVDPS